MPSLAMRLASSWRSLGASENQYLPLISSVTTCSIARGRQGRFRHRPSDHHAQGFHRIRNFTLRIFTEYLWRGGFAIVCLLPRPRERLRPYDQKNSALRQEGPCRQVRAQSRSMAPRILSRSRRTRLTPCKASIVSRRPSDTVAIRKSAATHVQLYVRPLA
jgi:hypothetical protein